MRTIIVTGANRGIGKAIAEELFNEGNNLSLGIRDLNSLKGNFFSEKNSRNKLITQYNALNKNDPIKLVKRTIKKFGSFDTVIHCAGILKKTRLLFKEEEEEDIKELINTNLMGPWRLSRAAWDPLVKAKNGRMIFLVSMSGKRSKGNLAGYSASKFGLMGICQTIRNEGWNQGIRVTAICPGWVNTDMASSIGSIQKDNMIQPQDIAKICSNILMLPNSSVPFEIKLNCLLEK